MMAEMTMKGLCHLCVAITREELDKITVARSLYSLQKRRQVEDAQRIGYIGSYCSSAVLGRFFCIRAFEDEIAACESR